MEASRHSFWAYYSDNLQMRTAYSRTFVSALDVHEVVETCRNVTWQQPSVSLPYNGPPRAVCGKLQLAMRIVAYHKAQHVLVARGGEFEYSYACVNTYELALQVDQRTGG